MKLTKLLEIRLDLFDGGAAAGDGGTAAPGALSGTQDGKNTGPAAVRRGRSGEFDNVIFGKQSQAVTTDGQTESKEGQTAQSSDAGSDETTKGAEGAQMTQEEKRKAYRELINGEYREFFAEDTQRIINRRFRETQNAEQQLAQYQPLVDSLMSRYGINDGDVTKLTAALDNDTAYWTAAAEAAGMDVEQYRRVQQLQTQNAELVRRERQRQSFDATQRFYARVDAETAEAKQTYPSLDLAAESQNPQFVSMLRSGVPVKTAYEVVHMDEIKAAAAAVQAKATEKQIVANIRAKGARTVENGTASQSSFIVKDDVSKLSKKERAEIAKRVLKGEKITF